MLDIKFIRENPEIIKKAVQDRQMSKSLDTGAFLALDKEYSELLKRVEIKRTLKNQLTQDIAKVAAEARQKLIEEATHIKDDLAILEKELDAKKTMLDDLLLKIPNLIEAGVPYGVDDSENVSIKKHGESRKFAFTPKDHLDLGKELDLIDVDTAAEVSGARFTYLKNEAAFLQFALVQLVFKTVTDQKLIKKLAAKVGNPFDNTFVPIIPPVIIKPDVMKKMARLDPIEERYYIPSDDAVLVGSAEHTLGPMHINKTFKYADLPIRYIGYSSAFRREAGSYGKDVRGILRLHQFDKLEMETFVPQEFGMQEQDLLVEIQEYLLQQLEIPYQVVAVCTGDIGKPDYRQIDLECWVPTQNKYRETHSADYVTDYQSRRLNTRYEDKDGSKKFVYMNDATALAIGRTLIAILENYQQEDGSVKIPKVLQNYVGKKEIRKPK